MSDKPDQTGLSAEDLAMIQDIVKRFRRAKDLKKEKPKVLSLSSLTSKEPKEIPLSTKIGDNGPPDQPPATPDQALADENPTVELPDENSND